MAPLQGAKEGKFYSGDERRKKNPIGKMGNVTKCAICSSEFHWARECPKNYRNKGKEQSKEGYTKEKVFLGEGGEEEERDHWDKVEAILDTGCNSTLCGDS